MLFTVREASIVAMKLLSVRNLSPFRESLHCDCLAGATLKKIVGGVHNLNLGPICRQIELFLNFVSNTTLTGTFDFRQMCRQVKYSEEVRVRYFPAPPYG